MSRANVDLVRTLQPDGVDLVQVFSAAPDELATESEALLFTDAFEVRFISETANINRLESRGVAGLVAMWREWLIPYASYQLDVEDYIDAGDQVVVFVSVQARTKRDDVLVKHTPAAIWWIRDGRVAALHFYLERAAALEAAGLTEEIPQKSE